MYRGHMAIASFANYPPLLSGRPQYSLRRTNPNPARDLLHLFNLPGHVGATRAAAIAESC
jgi:hypothetical protein